MSIKNTRVRATSRLCPSQLPSCATRGQKQRIFIFSGVNPKKNIIGW
jgi:hypothetical protein